MNNPKKETRSRKKEKRAAAPPAKETKKSKKTKMQVIKEAAVANIDKDDKEECSACLVKWDEMDGDRNIQCNQCSKWYCGRCSDTDTIPHSSIKKMKWFCRDCRKSL